MPKSAISWVSTIDQLISSLNNHILKQVEENPYLGLTLTENLKWSSHITKITKKAYSTIGFLGRNLKSCPQDCRKSAYILCTISLAISYVSHRLCAHLRAVPINFNCNDENRVLGKRNHEISDAIILKGIWGEQELQKGSVSKNHTRCK